MSDDDRVDQEQLLPKDLESLDKKPRTLPGWTLKHSLYKLLIGLVVLSTLFSIIYYLSLVKNVAQEPKNSTEAKEPKNSTPESKPLIIPSPKGKVKPSKEIASYMTVGRLASSGYLTASYQWITVPGYPDGSHVEFTGRGKKST